MKIGQMTLPKIAKNADFTQLDICGMNTEEALSRFDKNNAAGIPVIFHGDWTKNGFSENDVLREERQSEYGLIVNTIKEKVSVEGFTIHPPFRSKVNAEEFLEIVKGLEEETGIPFFIENRSNHRILVSKAEEVIEMSKLHTMTIDIPQLYISCGYCEETTIQTLEQLNWANIKEIHIANIKRDGTRTYVARKLNDSEGVLTIKKYLPFLKKVEFITLEILGGATTFEDQKNYLLSIMKEEV